MREREDANRTREAGHLDEIQCTVANTLKLHGNGAVGFIDWLGLFVSLLRRPLSRRVQIARGVEPSPKQRDSAEWQSV